MLTEKDIQNLNFTIPGNPVGKGRARVTRWGAYTPDKTVNYEAHVKESFISKYPTFTPLATPIKMYYKAYMKMPKVSKKKTEMMLTGQIRPTTKPDCSNILKAIEDALNNIAYKDDNQIIELTFEKYYSDRPRMEVEIKEFIGR